MTDKKRPTPVRKKAARPSRMASFQEVAKKFKPGPVAPPESEADRPDMTGAQSTTRTGALNERLNDDPAQGRMSDGKPGQLKKMPEE